MQLLITLICCMVVIMPHVAVGERSKAEALQTCLNAPGCKLRRTLWKDMLDDRPPCIEVHKVWWEEGSKQASFPVTLVTQLSVNRIPQLKAQCATWRGPLAAAVYLSVIGKDGESDLEDVASQRIQQAVADVEQLLAWAREGGEEHKCQLRIALLYEAFQQERAAVVLYPVNSLRNFARLMADTPLIANIDVDMLPSASLSDSLEGDSARAVVEGGSREGAGSVYVIPAFETTCGGPATADKAALLDKAGLRGLIKDECLTQFREKVAPACHNVTDFPRWFKAQASDPPYSVMYKAEFEPWFISGRRQTQWFDVRFRGYGKNKIVQVAATAAAGSPFLVHPSGFLVHRQHTESASRKAFLKVKFKSRQNAKLLDGSLYSHIESLWAESQARMATRGGYVPVLDDALQSCLRGEHQLDWWKD